ncbi:MAG TPA: serine/threonine-protein kinase [Solirubrobacteraceae bacterium]|nr:serine/threonine-protein kinase [Solirubrobacteraceae bacterium]
MESQTFDDRTRVVPRRPRSRGAWQDGPGEQALVLGRYRLRERLGAGGFGVVWSAHDEQLHRDVAVKRVALAPGEDAERATREALASARLAHPAIVALYEACPVDGAFYMISELVDGDTLARSIAEDALSDEQILRIGTVLCSALSHAHARGVVHRDVKPHNVLIPHDAADAHADVGARGRDLGAVAKLTDFGGARLSGEDVLTRTGDVLGTLAYMAPEQSEGREVGAQVDVYSLALVLYEALCGFNPVRGSTPAETARRIGRPVRSLARERRDLPRTLSATIDHCLHRSPAARGTLEQLADALEQALRESSPRGEEPIAARTRRRDRRMLEPTRVRGAAAPAPFVDAPPAPITPAYAALDSHERDAHEHQRAAGRVPPPQSIVQSESWGLPRLVWLAAALVLGVWQTASGRPGVGLLALAALLPIVLLPVGRRAQGASAGWLVCLLAPLLGVIGLAGAFPAIAGQVRRWRMRAAYAAVGYWWLVLAEPLLDRRLWLGAPSPAPLHAAWEGSFNEAAAHVLAPLLSLGALLGATLWAAGALVLPLIVRGRNAAVDVVGATIWSAALATAAPLLDAAVRGHTAQASPRGAILGAVLGGAVAVAARALRGPV